jgi:hypothetical protein
VAGQPVASRGARGDSECERTRGSRDGNGIANGIDTAALTMREMQEIMDGEPRITSVVRHGGTGG